MQFIDHPDLLIHESPNFKAMLPKLCQQLPIEPEIAEQLQLTVSLIVKKLTTYDPEAKDNDYSPIEEARQQLLSFWAHHCVTSEALSIVNHGVFELQSLNATYQFVHTALTHPVRDDLTMHAFSIAAFLNVDREKGTAELMGEDAGVHFTAYKKDPRPEDLKAIKKLVSKKRQPTYDDYLTIFEPLSFDVSEGKV